MKKIALIIGNAAYPESQLNNPVNDAESIGKILDRLSFYPKVYTDATGQIMEEALSDFANDLMMCEIALFFFAGHGMQIDGKNYLTAVDTKFDSEINAKYSSLPLDKLIETMEKGANKTNIIILDACRTNPYERKWRGVESQGLAPVYAPKGMIIGYATSPGQVAYDGDEKNGAYTDAFLKHVTTQDLSIEDLFKRVRNTLSSSTRGRQISWEHTSLMGDFYFNYSFVSTELISEYGKKAIADAEYMPSSNEARDIIKGLRSHNYYKQNPTISKIHQQSIKNFIKDDLFVIGRNVYQAACGNAYDAINYLDNLQDNLSNLDKNSSFHILNGIVFEIYFNSRGEIRKNAKAEMIDSVFRIEESDLFISSFKFVCQALIPYLKNIFYVPSSLKGISIDVSFTDYEHDMKVVDAIYFEGDNILYDESGRQYFYPSDSAFLKQISREEIKSSISKALVVPSFRLQVNFLGLPNNMLVFLVPYSMILQRLAI